MDELMIVGTQAVLTAFSTAFFGYIVWLLKEDRKEKSATTYGVQSLLKVKLIEYHDRYATKKEIPSYALENWNNMYKAYKNLGGNGVITQMDKEIQALKIAC